jgi:tetratricopeptide (TPR) repeat protein
METELSATRRALLHRRIGEAIEQLHGDHLDPWVDDLARHFAEAGQHEVERAVGYAVRAGEQAISRLAYEEAVLLLSRAVTLRRLADPVDHAQLATLELALAAAEADAGRWEAARRSYARAATAARAAGDGATFARAALGHSGGTWEQYGREDAESVGLIEEALERLAPGDSRLRSQALAQLAVLLYYRTSASWEELLTAADEAVAIARRLGDAEALVAALGAAQYARWRPGMAEDRLAIADELIEVTEARTSLVDAAEAHLWRVVALLELCRLDDAEPDLARYGEIAEQLQQYQLLVHRDAVRAMRALLTGDYEGGAQAAEGVLEWGRRAEAHGSAPMPMLLQYYGVETLALLNERDELGRLAAHFEQMVREIGALPGWRTPLAWAYVQSGRSDEARAELERLSVDGFAVFPRDANFLPALAIISHAIGELGDAALAARAEPLLEPYRHSWVVMGPGVSTLGPVAYSLGLLQLAQDRPEDASAAFELALERSMRMRARPYVARSRAGMAEALRRRGWPGDADRARELADLAAADADELGMTRLLRELEGCTSPSADG